MPVPMPSPKRPKRCRCRVGRVSETSDRLITRLCTPTVRVLCLQQCGIHENLYRCGLRRRLGDHKGVEGPARTMVSQRSFNLRRLLLQAG